MPLDAVVITESEAVLATPYVVLADNIADAGVTILEPHAQVFGEEFVLSSGGMYGNGNGLAGAVPNWLLTAIRNEMKSDSGVDIHTLMDNLGAAMDALSLGASQYITGVQLPGLLSQSAVITGLQSEIDANQASVINVLATKVTPTEAQALVENGIQSKFGPDVGAFVGSIASTYVDANSAIAQDIALISSATNSNSAEISTINGTITTLDSAIASQTTAVAVSMANLESSIIQSYTIYVDQNISYDVRIYSSRGSMFRKLDAYTELSCRVFKGHVEVTDSIGIPSFVWKRVSNDVGDDIAWNGNHAPSKTLTVTPADVNGRADFTCIVTITL